MTNASPDMVLQPAHGRNGTPATMLVAGIVVLLSCGCYTMRALSPEEQQAFNRQQVATTRARADAGVEEGQLAMARIYQAGLYGVARDDAESLKWLQIASDRNSLSARMQLAETYRRGTLGRQRDPGRAIEMYRAMLAPPPLATVWRGNAAYALGEIYERELGAASNIGQALEYYEIGAAAKHYSSGQRLATIYEMGIGVATDPVEAYRWHRIVVSYIGWNGAAADAQGKRLTASMSGDEVARAEQAARAWIAVQR